MPSPFPGMDPFLEHPDVFSDLHDRLVPRISDAIEASLPTPYFTRLNRRTWVEVAEYPRHIRPDVAVLRPDGPSGGVATAAPVSRGRMVVVTVSEDEIREPFLEIRIRRDGGERVVTVLEVLSPSNKTPGDHGRDLYLQKQREVLAGKTNLVEIDLLRSGIHTTAVPSVSLPRAGALDYHVCIHRFDRWSDYIVHPILLSERLPVIAVPLLPEDGSVDVDLQSVLDRVYDAAQYGRSVRYEMAEVRPQLRPDQMEWARGLLRERQLPRP